MLNLVILIAFSHISKAVNVHHQANCRYDDEHHHTNWRQAETDIKRKKFCKP